MSFSRAGERRLAPSPTAGKAPRGWLSLTLAAGTFAASCVCWIGVGPSAAVAQAGAPSDAVAHYRAARAHYESGQYREAASDLEQALEVDPNSPTLVFNLARVYELLGELDLALEYYERYQTLLPQQQADEQETADATIRRLRGARASQPEEAAPAPPPPAEVQPLRQLPGLVLVRENGVADAAFWVTLSGGLAAVVAGAACGGVALGERSAADGFVLGPGGRLAQRNDAFARARDLALAADVLLGVGGVAIAAAGVLYFAREQTVERAPVGAAEPRATAWFVAPVIGPDGRSVSVSAWGEL